MKLTAILTAAILVLALSACTTAAPESAAAKPLPAPQLLVQQAQKQNTEQVTQTLLTRQEAVDAALKAAGVKEADARDLDTELDRERGTPVWEVDFEVGTTEYDYDIDAATGEVLKADKKEEKAPSVQSSAVQEPPAAVQPEQPAPQPTQPESKPTQKETLLTQQEAVDAALKAAGVKEADARDLDAELDREKGTTVWEVDFEAGRIEYSFDIDASTGKILHQEKDIDD